MPRSTATLGIGCLIATLLVVRAAAAGEPAATATEAAGGFELAQTDSLCIAYDVAEIRRAGDDNDAIFLAVSNLITTLDRLGVDRDDTDIHVVLRGEAALMALTHQTFERTRGSSENPHADDLAMLLHADASVEVCGETMSRRGWTAEDILPGVTVVPGAVVRLVDLQNRGCAYIRF